MTFLGVGAGVVVLAAWAAWWALPSRLVPAPDAVPVAAAATDGIPVRSYALLFLGVLALSALVCEGAAADWSAVYVRDSLGSSAGFAAYAYASFSIVMVAGRLFGDRLAQRFGPVNLVRVSGVVAAAGLGVTLLIGRPVAAVIGFGFLGAGMACIAPQVYSAAGNRDPARAGRALSTVVSIAYVGFVLGPILIGAASTYVGLPRALVIPVVLAVGVAAGATALRPPAAMTSQPATSPSAASTI